MSNKKYNPLTDSANIGINTLKDILIATHGILMLVTWPMLSFTAILFATWMKPALPNGQWFQVKTIMYKVTVYVVVCIP